MLILLEKRKGSKEKKEENLLPRRKHRKINFFSTQNFFFLKVDIYIY